MSKRVSILFIGAFYELLRFVLLLVLSVAVVNPGFDVFIMLYLLLIGSPALVLSGGSFLAGMYPGRYGIFTKLIAFGKALGLLPLLLIVFNSVGILTSGITGAVPGALLYILLGVIVLDLIFFIFLVSYRVHVKPSGGPDAHTDSASTDDLPEWHETRIEE
ncbi:MAG: hypothetical protein ACOCX6_00765 [bacterium]